MARSISRSKASALAVVVAVVGVFGSIRAQEAPASNQAPALVAVNEAEQVTTSRAVLERATVLSQRIQQMLDEARRESDIIRVTCLNDKLTQVNANLRTAQTRMSAFTNATTPEQRTHEATVLGVLGQKFQVLDQEANGCVGQDLYATGSTTVQTEIDTALQPYEEDVVNPLAPPSPAVPDIPLLSSPTR